MPSKSQRAGRDRDQERKNQQRLKVPVLKQKASTHGGCKRNHRGESDTAGGREQGSDRTDPRQPSTPRWQQISRPSHIDGSSLLHRANGGHGGPAGPSDRGSKASENHGGIHWRLVRALIRQARSAASAIRAAAPMVYPCAPSQAPPPVAASAPNSRGPAQQTTARIATAGVASQPLVAGARSRVTVGARSVDTLGPTESAGCADR